MTVLNPIDNWNLQFAHLVTNQIPNGFVSGVIVGERRKGKSAYAMKVGAKICKIIYGLPDDDCWEYALSCFVFGPNNLSDRIEENNKKDVLSPYWVIDDATVHFNPILFFINPFLYSYLQGIFDTIGTVVNGLVLTCPKKQRLMKGLRVYDDLTIHIIKDIGPTPGYERIARGILWFTMPDDKQRYRKQFEDHYSCYIPQDVYNKYLKTRKHYLKETNDLLIALRKKLDSEKTKKLNIFNLISYPSPLLVPWPIFTILSSQC
jgi:hypothetical protein